MKWTKLSLVATLAMSAAFAGGDIAPVEPMVEAPVVEAACNANTTIDGKATAYYYTYEGTDLFDGATSNLGAGVTVNVSHKITDNVTANVTALGYTNVFGDDSWEFEGWGTSPKETGAFLNVANITATYGDTTFILGRQLLSTPTVSGFDWLLAPGSFEAYTVVNTSIDKVTLVGSFITKYRANNTGDEFGRLGGKNWTVGAAYSDAFDASVWYYNVDALGYTQVYADAGTKIADIDVAAQYVNTDWDGAVPTSDAFGIKASGSVAGFDLMAAYVNVSDAPAGFVDNDSMYTSMWNSLGSAEVGDAFKVGAATTISDISVDAAYAGYSNDSGYDGHEFDLVLGYEITKCIDVAAIYSNTDAAISGYTESNALEFIANYKF